MDINCRIERYCHDSFRRSAGDWEPHESRRLLRCSFTLSPVQNPRSVGSRFSISYHRLGVQMFRIVLIQLLFEYLFFPHAIGEKENRLAIMAPGGGTIYTIAQGQASRRA